MKCGYSGCKNKARYFSRVKLKMLPICRFVMIALQPRQKKIIKSNSTQFKYLNKEE